MMNKKSNKIFKNLNTERKWFNVNKSGEVPEVLIYDMIGTDFWGDGVSPKSFRLALSEIQDEGHKKINLRINSPGGFVSDGFTIYNTLTQSGLDIDVYIDGLAASMASVIAMAGNKVYMAENAELMIHNVWSIVVGDFSEMEKEAQHLRSLTAMIANIYSKKTGIESDEILRMMAEETWMSGSVAAELGFIDEVVDGEKVAACVFELDEDILPNLPENFKKIQNAIQKRNKEKDLRDAGLSRSEAKTKLAEEQQRDAEKTNSDSDYNEQNKNIIKELQQCQMKLKI